MTNVNAWVCVLWFWVFYLLHRYDVEKVRPKNGRITHSDLGVSLCVWHFPLIFQWSKCFWHFGDWQNRSVFVHFGTHFVGFCVDLSLRLPVFLLVFSIVSYTHHLSRKQFDKFACSNGNREVYFWTVYFQVLYIFLDIWRPIRAVIFHCACYVTTFRQGKILSQKRFDHVAAAWLKNFFAHIYSIWNQVEKNLFTRI